VGVIETPIGRPQTKSAEVDRFRLRRLSKIWRVLTKSKPRPDAIELADVAAALQGNPRAVHFRAVGAEGQELVGNVTGSRARLARAFGVKPAALLARSATLARPADHDRTDARRGAGPRHRPPAMTLI